MRKGACFFMMLAACLMVLAAGSHAQEKPKYGGKLVLGHDIDAVGLDPYKTPTFASTNYYEQFYNSLLRFDEKNNLQPELALSWESPDPKTYIFKLRQGVKFHDGKEFGAEDVKATVERALDPKTASVRRPNFKLVDRVDVVDKYTVRFILKEPFAPLLHYLGSVAHSAILSKDVIEKADPDKVMVGTGAFQVVDYKPNDKMLLKKNPNYWEKGLPYLDEMEIRLIKDASSRVAALRAKSVDYVWIIEPQLVQVLSKEKGINGGKAPNSGRLRVYFNCTKPPFDNVKVRQALSSATDRNEIIRVTLMGEGALSGPIPPVAGEFAYPPEKLPFYDYNPERAKKLLAEAGYPSGLKATAKVSAMHPSDQYALQVMQRQWKNVGVDIEIVQVEWGTLINDAAKLNHQILLLTDLWRPDADEYVLYDRDISVRSGFKSDDVEKLTLEGLTTLDVKKRQEIYHEIEKKLAEYSPIIYVYARPQRFEFWRDYVKGYTPTPQCSRVNFKQAWLDK